MNKSIWIVVSLGIVLVFALAISCSDSDDSDGEGDGQTGDNACSEGSISFTGSYECLPEDLELPDIIEVEREELGITQDIDTEDYVKGVLYHEMGPSFPFEALKAQAVAIRSYAIRWMMQRDDPICDSTMCQVYGDERDDTTDAAVDETKGVVVIFDGQVAETVYHASSGGFTEDVEDVWGSDYASYLKGVFCMENAHCTNDCGECPDEGDGVCDTDSSECCWGRSGHGVGLSQRGAQAMAECGFDHQEILSHYYSDVTLAEDCG